MNGFQGEKRPHDEIIDHILESIAQEEMAIANLMNAEAEKIRKVIMYENFPEPDDFSHILTFQKIVAEILEKLIQKQNLIIKKLDLIKDLKVPKKEKPQHTHMPYYDNEE